MKKIALVVGLTLLIQAYAAYGEEDATYLDVKGGIFMPNGNSKGLKDFDTGYNVDVAVGVRPAPYAAVELATGVYSASAKISETVGTRDMTAYGVPITLTAKAIANFKRLDIFAGAGAGYYFCFIDNKVNNTSSPPAIEESVHGGAVGYQVLAGGDYRIDDQWSVGVQFKWFSTRPELEVTNIDKVKTKDKWEFGGTNLNVGFKYNF